MIQGAWEDVVCDGNFMLYIYIFIIIIIIIIINI